jgi:hypothetical protein
VKVLCDHGADINSTFYKAVNSDDKAVMGVLIENGADVDWGSEMQTTLYHAAENGNESMSTS